MTPVPVALSGATLLIAIVLPVAAYLGKTILESYLKWRSRQRGRLGEIEDVLAEIRLMRESGIAQANAWRTAFQTDVLQKRVLERRYAPYLPPIEADHSAYDKLRANVDFLAPATIRALRSFYDTDSLVKKMLNDLRSDHFRDLAHDRKIELFARAVELLTTHDDCARIAIYWLRHNRKLIRHVKWRTFLLDSKWLYAKPRSRGIKSRE